MNSNFWLFFENLSLLIDELQQREEKHTKPWNFY